MKRYELLARKNGYTILFHTYNELEFELKRWELKMQGFSIEIIE